MFRAASAVTAVGTVTAVLIHAVRRRWQLWGRPQRAFRHVLADPSPSAAPFRHLSLRDGVLVVPSTSNSADCEPPSSSTSGGRSCHPYSAVIEGLVRGCAAAAVSPCVAVPLPAPVEETPLLWVDTRAQLDSLAAQLAQMPAFALDIEHHALRSYYGVTCLLQVSTGDANYLIDALKLHDHLGDALRGVLGDPRIVKVMHGASNDVLWLQRDFHCYIVNLFDTQVAALQLGRQQTGLSHLLRVHCGAISDKRFQRADWRVRPLSHDLLRYAALDVHYGLYLSALLQAELAALHLTRSDGASRDGAAPALAALSSGQPPTHPSSTCNDGTVGSADGIGAAVSGTCAAEFCDGFALSDPADAESTAMAAAAVGGAVGFGASGKMSPLAATWFRSHRLSLSLYRQPDADSAVAAAAGALLRKLGYHHHPPQAGAVTGAAGSAGPAAEPPSAAPAARAGTAGLPWGTWEAQRQADAPAFEGAAGMAVAAGGTGGTEVRNCVAALCRWRDGQARTDDDSPAWVLPDVVLLALLDVRPACPRVLSHLLRDRVARLDATLHGEAPLATRLHASRSALRSAATLCKLLQPGGAAAAAARSPAAPAPAPARGDAPLPPSTLNEAKQRKIVLEPELKRQLKRQWIIDQFTVKNTQVYEGCRMLSRSGELLCHCDRRKLRWYLSKGLAEVVHTELDVAGAAPQTIRLLFDHKVGDQVTGADAFYADSKRNACVVCGESRHFLRYRVVPSCYRRFLPAALKSHRSHDVVLLCVDDHEAAHKAAEVVKRHIASELGIPLSPPACAPGAAPVHDGTQPPHAAGTGHGGGADDGPEAEDGAPAPHTSSSPSPSPSPSPMDTARVVRRAACVLQQKAAQLPAWRIRELENVVRKYLALDGSAEETALGKDDLLAASVAGLDDRKRGKVLRRAGHGAASSALGAPDSANGAGLANHNFSADTGGAGDDCDSSAAMEALAGQPAQPVAAGAAAHTTSVPAGSGATPAARPAPRPVELVGQLWHGERVVSHLMSTRGDAGLLDLMRRFRTAFVEACRPRHLPATWGVDHHAPRQFGPHSVFAQAGTGTARGDDGRGSQQGAGSHHSSGEEEEEEEEEEAEEGCGRDGRDMEGHCSGSARASRDLL